MRTSADRIRNRLPTPADRQMQIDVDDTFVEVGQLPLHGLRTSLIVDPPDGLLPPLLPIAKARIADSAGRLRMRLPLAIFPTRAFLRLPSQIDYD